LRRELGRGAHGVVILAHDPVLRRDVALKVPRPETLITDEMRRRFQREAEIAARLDHPNLIAIHEVGQAGAYCYLVTAYCSGPPLAKCLRGQPGPLPPSDAACLLVDIAEAIAYMHAQGVLHRDIKPGNILLEKAPNEGSQRAKWVPKLTDFGLAKPTENATR